jgi:hypothetical protein
VYKYVEGEEKIREKGVLLLLLARERSRGVKERRWLGMMKEVEEGWGESDEEGQSGIGFFFG